MSDLGARLKIIRDIMGLAQKGMAEKYHTHQRNWSRYESGLTELPKEILNALAAEGIDMNWLFTGQGKPFLPTYNGALKHNGDTTYGSGPYKKEVSKEPAAETVRQPVTSIKIIHPSEIGPKHFLVPLLNQKLSAGHGVDLVEVEEEQALIPAPDWLSHFGRNIFGLIVEGDSMEPTLKHKDFVICDTYGWSYEGVYALQLGDQDYVKRLQKLPKVYRIISDNPRYPIMEEPVESQDIRILGLIRLVMRMME